MFDSLPLIMRAFNHGVEPFVAHPPTDREWMAAFGPHEPRVMARFIAEENVDEAYRRFYTYYQEHIAEIPLFPGIREILYRLKDLGIKIGLFTGGGRMSTELCLGTHGILPLFGVLITGDSVSRPKPDPEGVVTAMKTLGVDASGTLVVGDSSADVESGKRAGASSALVRWSSLPSPYTSAFRPDYTWDAVAEFERFLFGEK